MSIKGTVIHGRAYDISSSKTSHYRHVKTFHIGGVPVRLTSRQLLMIRAGDEVSVGSFGNAGIINAQIFYNRSKNYWAGNHYLWMLALGAAAGISGVSWSAEAIQLTIESGQIGYEPFGFLMIGCAFLIGAGGTWAGVMSKRMIDEMEKGARDSSPADKPAPHSDSQPTPKSQSATDGGPRTRDEADDMDRMF